MNTKAYFDEISSIFDANRNELDAIEMKRYMRNQFEFFGIKKPLRAQLQRDFLKAREKPSIEQLPELAVLCYGAPERELQYFANELLGASVRQCPPSYIALYGELATTKSWWDTVDTLASNIVGAHLFAHPDLIEPTITSYRTSGNIWLERTAIIFQLKYKKQTNEALLFDIIYGFENSKEFFIQKAIGWALREYSKTEPKQVIDFIDQSNLSNFSKKEGLKWIQKQLDS